MLNVAFVVAVALTGLSDSNPLKPSETSGFVAVEPPVPVEDEEIGTEELLILLQMMCVIMNCSFTQNGAELSVQAWVETHRTSGLRPHLSPEIRAEAGVKLQRMDHLAASGAGRLAPALRDEFRESIANILEELGE
jgi:hypothetical protein